MFRLYQKYHEIIFYLIFGVLTTVVYFIFNFLVLHLTHNAVFSAIIGNIIAIIFAYITNKLWVFKQAKRQNVFFQFFKYAFGRVIVAAIDPLTKWICIDLYGTFFIHILALDHLTYQHTILSWPLVRSFIGSPSLLNNFLWSIVAQILIIILNYLFSKLIVFRSAVKTKR